MADTVADFRGLYRFGRCIDGLLRLSQTPQDAPHPADAEFTFYDRPLLAGDGHGNTAAQLLAPFGHKAEQQAGFQPIPFPRSPEPLRHMPEHRLDCEQFLQWAADLALPEPLTAIQVEELGHVGCSEVGVGRWCEVGGTHGEQCLQLSSCIERRLSQSILVMSDTLEIAVHPIAPGTTLAHVLNGISSWLERAKHAEDLHTSGQQASAKSDQKSNAMDAEHETTNSPNTCTHDRPHWNSQTSTLSVKEHSKTARSNAVVVSRILEAFERAGWPDGRVLIDGISMPQDRLKCIDRFLKGWPINIRNDGTGR